MRRTLKHISTPFGDIAYAEKGDGPPALFVHGVFLNGYLWRHVIDQVSDLRRCIAIDLMAHGETRTRPSADMSFKGQAEMLASVCDALGLESVDVVANDSGGGIAQIFAATNPQRIRSLTLTNCDTHDNWPPAAFKQTVDNVIAGGLRKAGQAILASPEAARKTLSIGYQWPEKLSDETINIYLRPILGSLESIATFEQFFKQMDNSQTVAAEQGLRSLKSPTLIVWGAGDVFFDVKWARWLKDTIPGTREPVIIEGAKLFFPEERPDDLVAPLRALWAS